MERVSPLLGRTAGLLLDMAALLQNLDLAARLVFDRLADEADRVDVLDLAARTERRARLAHRHVHVGAQVSFSMSPSQYRDSAR